MRIQRTLIDVCADQTIAGETNVALTSVRTDVVGALRINIAIVMVGRALVDIIAVPAIAAASIASFAQTIIRPDGVNTNGVGRTIVNGLHAFIDMITIVHAITMITVIT